MEERIQKIIASSGFCSRRKAEEFIIEGKVLVNGKKAEIGAKADSKKDRITVNGNEISIARKVYYLLNKPKEVLVTKNDPRCRKTIYDLESVRNLEKLIAVGRLDMMSEGLIILTNDGDFANKVMHPRYNVDKTYQVRVDPEFSQEDIEEIEEGVMIEGKKTTKAEVDLIKKNEIKITIHEGRNRIIRKIMEKLGYKVYSLVRVSIGKININGLGAGMVRELTSEEIKELIK